jgi:hypothetical protein
MSLKVIAEETLARLRPGAMDLTQQETELKQVKQPSSCFMVRTAGLVSVKHSSARKTKKNGFCFTVPLPSEVNDATSLPIGVVAGLNKLRVMSTPRIAEPAIWPSIVADALRLAWDAWAVQALALGWQPLELWGCAHLADCNPSSDGLAVWLQGRRVLLLDDKSCIVEASPTERAVFNRRLIHDAVFLWNLGRKQSGG